ncbi:MAG: pyridoxal phosphate-dependent aminotransferase [Candidatus Kerfeldbacteria bacterium]|nr:pyridoxal phosphate-dependent aminotransferase [Candidatus Kerfeldbacteria bacterium]
MLQISTRASQLQASPLRKLAGAAEERKTKGVRVFHLNIGQPDLKTPDSFFETLKTLSENPIAYSQSQGKKETIAAWQRYYATLSVELSEKEIVITTGGSEALQFAFNVVADSGDEVIVFEPFYTNYNAFSTVAGTKLVPVTLDIANGFHLPSREVVEAAITPRTRAILVCNPSNPTGTVMSEDELQMIADMAKAHDLFIIADEVYREFVFEGLPKTFLTHTDIADRLIVVDSASKRFNLCGARVGTLVSRNMDVMQAVVKLAMSRLASPSVEQLALIPVIDGFAQTLPSVVAEYRARLDTAYELLGSIPGVTLHKPEGAFYMIIGLPVESAEDFCKWTIEEFADNNETVLVAPAAGFYATPGKGRNEIRIACVLQIESLTRAIHLIHLALKAYPYGKSI